MRKNNAIVKKLTKRTLKINKKRNFFMIAAIAMTALMITSVLSISMSMVETVQTQNIRLAGSKFHVSFPSPTLEQLEKLQELDYVEIYGTKNHIGFVQDLVQADASLVYFDDNFFHEILSPAIANITGNLPREANEIMTSRWILERLGIENPEIGMHIPLSFMLIDEETIQEETFVLSGFYTSFDHFARGEGYVITSEALAQQFGKGIRDGHSSVNILFQDSRHIQQNAERLVMDLDLTSEQVPNIHHVFDTDYVDYLMMMISVAFIVLFFMFTGYLLIYNVLYISVTRDIRFYGLLKTIGTTPKQIRQMVIGQAMRLCIIGIPIGIMLGLLVSFVLVPLVIHVQAGVVISFSPLIYMGAVVFTMITTFIGAFSPARKVANISTIDATKYIGEINTRGYGVSRTNGKLYKMALRNLFRDRKRAIVVFLSLFLGVTTFISLTLIASSLDVDKHVVRLENDFILQNIGYIGVGTNYEESYPFNGDFLEQVATLSGIDDIQKVTTEFAVIPNQEDFESFEAFDEEILLANIFGIDSAVLAELNADFDIEAFDRGEFVVIATNQPELFEDVTDIEGSFHVNNEIFNFYLGGFVPANYHRWMSRKWSDFDILVSNIYLEQLIDGSRIMEIRINSQDGYDIQIYETLQEMTRGDINISMRSRVEERQLFEDGRIILSVLSCGVLLILGGIGILNFISTISMEILGRKRELAMLESIGMTRKQLRKMLVYEGVWYGVITLLFVATIGNGVAVGLYKQLVAHEEFSEVMTFVYPFIPTVIVAVMILAVCIIVPETFYRTLNKQSIIERLREAV